ncbi:MAG: hypothetical protein EXX96DRAFT_611523 [Benjaminiella poitrasii]|nr:MAG: hypothetical protein EXX96DRAFT_611512 [Benjaminiella poitrasii]KAI9472288.1 MAG: hypothetical protein EXX96DRAFT_611523 [Benjaminiella poitrasii]
MTNWEQSAKVAYMEGIQEAIRGKECTVFFKKPDLIKQLSINEASFNRALVWPLRNIAVDSIGGDLMFAPGEYILKASKEEYKANSVVLDDNPKYGLDHIKGTFGILTVFNNIFKIYYLSTEATATSLKITFVHARHAHVHLWTLRICAKNIYALKKVFKFKIPNNRSDSKNILAMGHFVWQLKRQLEEVHSSVQRMKQEHDGNVISRIMDIADTKAMSLKEWIDSKIKKPVKDTEYGLLLPVEKNEDEERLRLVKLVFQTFCYYSRWNFLTAISTIYCILKAISSAIFEKFYWLYMFEQVPLNADSIVGHIHQEIRIINNHF